jgi:hypothetical protein
MELGSTTMYCPACEKRTLHRFITKLNFVLKVCVKCEREKMTHILEKE